MLSRQHSSFSTTVNECGKLDPKIMTGVPVVAVEGDGRLSIRCLIEPAKKATPEEWSPCLRKMTMAN